MKFSVMWANNATHTRPGMSSFRATLRDPLGPHIDGGIGGRAVHLDQVHVQFRPSTSIAAGEFQAGDGPQFDWRAETQTLYVRTTPGARHTLYTRSAQADASETTVRCPHRPLVYSGALHAVPQMAGDQDLWCRTYRPLRDLPVVEGDAVEQGLSELGIKLLWPLLQDDTQAAATYVPDYRMLRVLCDFSVR